MPNKEGILEDQLRELERQFSRIIKARLNRQWIVLREYWEPRLVDELMALVDDCMLAAKSLSARRRNAPGAVALPALMAGQFTRDCEEALGRRLILAKAALLDMVRETVLETGETITIDGLAGDMPRLDRLGADGENSWADRLAGGVALTQSVRKSQAEFVRRVLADLDDPACQSQSSAEWSARLASHGSWWRGRLQTIAVTVLHAVFNRSQLAAFNQN